MSEPERTSLMGILRKGFELYAKNFKDIIIIALIIYAPISILDFFPIKVDFEVLGFTSDMLSMVPKELEGLVSFNLLADIALAYLIGIFLAPLGMMAVSYISYYYLEDKKFTYKEALEFSFKKWGRFVATSLLRAFISLVSFFAMMTIPMALGGVAGTSLLPYILPIVLSVCFAFSDYCVIIESKWGMAALVRSIQLVRSNRNWVRVIGYSTVFYLIEFSFILLTGGVKFIGSLVAYCLACIVICAQSCWFHNVKLISDSQMQQ